MADAPKRRWLRFSLRTMFVAFTVVAVWLGWNVYIVRQRKAFISSLPAPCLARAGLGAKSSDPRERMTAEQVYLVESLALDMDLDAVLRRRGMSPGQGDPFTKLTPTISGELSWLRQQLGDQPYWLISYLQGPSAARAHALFPEAIVSLRTSRGHGLALR
jgi:hypothetical protein